MKKEIWIAVAAALAIVIVVSLFTSVSYNNSAADAEVLVIQAKDNCASTYDNGIKSVLEMAQVQTSSQEFILSALKTNPETPGAYEQFVNGNPAPLFLLMSAVSGTNITATAENVQREVSAQRSAMLVCSKTLNATQAELKKILGMDASGRVKKWPQTWLNLDYPSLQNDPALRDNDGDFRLTVLDYRPPVNIAIRDAFGTGEGLPTIQIYPTAP